MSAFEQSCARAAALLRSADAVVITSGAGMGVDSGLPDFRGPEGFWRAYPALGRAGIAFESIASPDYFHADPELAWGFYGHRLALYRRTIPHAGFALLREIARRTALGAFVFTSNVDGQFQKAGFAAERVLECHGSLHHLQCLNGCTQDIHSAHGFDPEVDEQSCRLISTLPACPRCGGLARPNVLMFGDWHWNRRRTGEQEQRLESWLAQARRPVVVEIGAGTSIPTVRRFGEALRQPLVRINLREPAVQRTQDVAIASGARAGIEGIARALELTPPSCRTP